MNKPTHGGSTDDLKMLSEHADWLLQHPEFSTSARLKRLLDYLVQRSISHPSARITQEQIARNILGAGPSFNPSSDAHVRIEISRLRKALDGFYCRHEHPDSTKIDLPKGSYRPSLISTKRSVPIAVSTVQDLAPSIAIADLYSNDHASAETAFMIRAETVAECRRSILAQAGALMIYFVSGSGIDESLGKARQTNSVLLLTGQVFSTSQGLRVYLALLETMTGRLIWDHAAKFDPGQMTSHDRLDGIAHAGATQLTDPLLGAGPAFLASAFPKSIIAEFMSAYEFMSTQNVGLVDHALASLTKYRPGGNGSPTGTALFADMTRVAANMCIGDPETVSNTYALDLAEEAVQQDNRNPVALLTLGYALLASGKTNRAHEVAQSVLMENAIGSLVSDATLLSELCVMGGASDFRRQETHAGRSKPSFFMNEITGALQDLQNGDAQAALDKLERSSNEEIFWFHLFKTAIYCEAGNQKKAQLSAERLQELVPGISHFAQSTIAGFFSDPGFQEFLLDGLRRTDILR